jgi:group I intron endonuclease
MDEELTGVIYKITSPNNKIYIGQTINFKNRCRKYKYNEFKRQIKLWNNCVKYKWNPIETIEIIEVCLINDLDKREIDWINKYDSYYNGLNSDLGGKGRRGYKHSDETKEKLRKINFGKKHTEESKMKISQSSKNMSEETREKIRNKSKGRRHTEETKLMIGNLNRGRKLTEEQKLKVSNANIGNKKRLGKYHSDETKKKISESKKGVSNITKKIKIINVTTGEIYDSATDAGRILNIRPSNISRVCLKQRKSYKGLVFMFYDEYLKNG